MSKVLRAIAVVVLAVLLGGVFVGLCFFKFVQHRIASNLQPPRLQEHFESSSDLVFHSLDQGSAPGQTHHLSETHGKVVLLDLWGTWCVQCVAEMPTVQRLYDHYRSDPEVEFLIVSRLDSSAAVRSYAHRNHFDLPFYLTDDSDIPPTMQLNQFPSTFLYAKDGTLAAKHVGAADWSDKSVITFIDKLKQQR